MKLYGITGVRIKKARSLLCSTASFLFTLAATGEQVRLGDLKIDPEKRSIIIPAKVNQTDAIAEFLLVHEQGKVHESVFSTSINAVELNTALNLLGLLTDKKNKSEIPILASLKHLPKVEVFVANEDQSEWKPATEFYQYKGTNSAPKAHPWHYNGSYFFRDKFMAQVEGDLIAIYTNVNALINLEHPDRKDDTVWIASAKSLGKQGTPVYLKIVVPEKASD